MTPEQRIDEALDAVFRAAGLSLIRHKIPDATIQMREAMRKIMSDSYIQGSNDCKDAIARGNATGSMKR